MRNYTLRIAKKSSLFSLLIITLWVLPICTSCNFKNTDHVEEIQPQHVPVVNAPEITREEIIASENSWVCVVCTQENDQRLTKCQQCNVVRPAENPAQPLGDKKEEEQKKEEPDSRLEEEEALNQVDPNKDQCPVCLEWFTKEEQQKCKYWECTHFVCAPCYGKIRTAKKLHDYCPTCRCEKLRPQPGEEQQADTQAR